MYLGNVPSNVNKTAKYSVVNAAGNSAGMEIRLVYLLGQREKTLVTTRSHTELVTMVNAVKKEHGGSDGGAFYINEYGHVLVPAGDDCHCAGKYDRYLEFEFEGLKISPKPPEDAKPGDPWKGPQVGIRHTLAAGGVDIRYKSETRPGVEKDICLSDFCGSPAAKRLAGRLADIKGRSGGRIYINEARAFFTPTAADSNEFVYLGSLDEDEWFPAPLIR